MDSKTTQWPQKAYKNLDFLNSPDARGIRVLCELIEPEIRMARMNIQNLVVFFGSARTLPMEVAQQQLKEARTLAQQSQQPSPQLESARIAVKMARYYEDARALAARLTTWSKSVKDPAQRLIVCSGGGPGIMEAANRGAMEADGPTVGMNISLPMEQKPNPYQTQDLSFEFHYFFMRKFWFVHLAKAFVVFPGGFGTCDEFFELLTLIQTKKATPNKRIVLYGTEYWNEVINIESMIKWGTIDESDQDLFTVTDDIDYAFACLTDTPAQI